MRAFLKSVLVFLRLSDDGSRLSLHSIGMWGGICGLFAAAWAIVSGHSVGPGEIAATLGSLAAYSVKRFQENGSADAETSAKVADLSAKVTDLAASNERAMAEIRKLRDGAQTITLGKPLR